MDDYVVEVQFFVKATSADEAVTKAHILMNHMTTFEEPEEANYQGYEILEGAANINEAG